MKVLVTGASGFIGAALCKKLDQDGAEVIALLRKNVPELVDIEQVICELDDVAKIRQALIGVDVVVHLAGRAHRLNEKLSDPLAVYRKINRDLAVLIAELSMDAQVKRFVFVSTIAVNGMETGVTPVNELSEPHPAKAYAVSKYEAENELVRLLKDKMELVIVRPPLVYSGRAVGNFERLLKLVKLGIPLPFASVTAKRSIISLGNLLEFLILVLTHPKAANELFVVSDGVDISLPEMLRLLAEGMGKHPNVFPVPVRLLHFGAVLCRKEALFSQLCGPYLIDSSKSRRLLSWTPSYNVHVELSQAAKDFSTVDK
ncbi:NAD-dependent epimerase/dehydratase family protein [Pseudomonas gregormendelii]